MNSRHMKLIDEWGNAAEGLRAPFLIYFDPDLEAMGGKGYCLTFDGVDHRFSTASEAAFAMEGYVTAEYRSFSEGEQ